MVFERIFLFGTLSFVLSFGLIVLFMKVATGLGLVDRPNDRSSHVTPTVKGGGIVFSSVYLLVLSLLYVIDPQFKSIVTVILITCPYLLIIGWLDDRFNLSALLRLIFHLILSVVIIFLLTRSFQDDLQLLFLPSLFWLNLLFSILFISWFTNLYNFMDGADGLAASTAIVCSVILSGFTFVLGAEELAIAYFVIGTSVAGFLPWNWQPARLFMGESGSYFLGITFASLALIGKVELGLSMYPTIILFGLFIVDPTYTLVIRVFRRLNPLKPHRHFAFHKLLKRGWSHKKVSILYSLVAVFWLMPMAYLSLVFNDYAFYILVISYMPLICYTIFVKAGND